MNRNHKQLPDSPYKGLMPYSEEDAPFFFGREAEREIISANLLAARVCCPIQVAYCCIPAIPILD